MNLRICAVSISAALLVSSCERMDHAQESHVRAAHAMRRAVGEIQSSIVERQISNAVSLIERAESNTLSNEYYAQDLRSLYSTLWVNTNFNDWAASVTKGQPRSDIAMAGKYQVDGKAYYLSVSFSDIPIKRADPPGPSFRIVPLAGGDR